MKLVDISCKRLRYAIFFKKLKKVVRIVPEKCEVLSAA